MKPVRSCPGRQRLPPGGDVIGLARGQRADVHEADGRLRSIVDHPLNAPLLGTGSSVATVRADELILLPGDRTVFLFANKAGTAVRIASAEIERCRDTALRLKKWKVAAGFERSADTSGPCRVHRVFHTDQAKAERPVQLAK